MLQTSNAYATNTTHTAIAAYATNIAYNANTAYVANVAYVTNATSNANAAYVSIAAYGANTAYGANATYMANAVFFVRAHNLLFFYFLFSCYVGIFFLCSPLWQDCTLRQFLYKTMTCCTNGLET